MNDLPQAAIDDMMGEPDEAEVYFLLDIEADHAIVLRITPTEPGDDLAWVH